MLWFFRASFAEPVWIILFRILYCVKNRFRVWQASSFQMFSIATLVPVWFYKNLLLCLRKPIQVHITFCWQNYQKLFGRQLLKAYFIKEFSIELLLIFMFGHIQTLFVLVLFELNHICDMFEHLHPCKFLNWQLHIASIQKEMYGTAPCVNLKFLKTFFCIAALPFKHNEQRHSNPNFVAVGI